VSRQDGELPHGWTPAKLGDVLEFKYGKSLPAKRREGSGYSVFGSNGIVGEHSEAFVDGPTLIIGRKGSIGEIHQSDAPCWPIDTTYFVNNFNGQPIRFWYHQLKVLPLAELNRATALPGLNRSDAYDLSVKVPPIAEQQRIVEKIEALQEQSRRAREALSEVGPLLEQFRQSVLAATFQGDLTADWRAAHPNVEPASELLLRIRAERRRRWEQAELAKYEAKGQKPPKNWKDKYKEPEPVDDSDLPELPKGWAWTTLPELSWDASYGTSEKCDFDATGLPILRIPNIANGRISLHEVKRSVHLLEILHDDHIHLNDFLIVRTNGSRDLIGRAALVENPLAEPSFFASYLIRYRLLGGEKVGRWVSMIWASPTIRAEVQHLAATSAGQYNVSLAKLSSIILPLPPLEEMKTIIEVVNEGFDRGDLLMDLTRESDQKLDHLDQSILAKAFRGELVPQDPSDEPASALLEHIRAQRTQRAESTKHTSKAPRRSKMTKKLSKLTPQQLTLAEVLTTQD
jgi:type I restriction enzyme, S subunit